MRLAKERVRRHVPRPTKHQRCTLPRDQTLNSMTPISPIEAAEKKRMEAVTEDTRNVVSGEVQQYELPAIDQQPTSRYVWYVILLLAGVNAFNYVDRMALAVLASLIKEDLQLTDSQLGLLTGWAFALFYAVCALPIARWADRGIRRDIIAMAIAVWSAMTALSGTAKHFWHLFFARVGVGVGEAGSFAPAASIICDYVPLNRRSGALALLTFGNAIGLLVGMALAGWLGQTIGWRMTFLVLGLPGLALALLVRFTLREPTRGLFDTVQPSQTSVSLRETLGFLLHCRTYRLLTIYLVTDSFFRYGLIQWLPSFYGRLFDADLATVGVYLGIAIGAGMGTGMLIGGFTANKAARRDVRLPMRIGVVARALSIPAALGSLFVPSLSVSIALVWLDGFFAGVASGPVLATQYSVVNTQMRATAGAISIFIMSVLGFGLGPVCVGVMSDFLAPSLGVESLRYAMLVPLCVSPVMLIALFAASKTLSHDLVSVAEQPKSDRSAAASAPTKG